MQLVTRLIALVVIVAAIGLWVTRPRAADPALLDGITADAARGEMVFHAAGCASCHIAPGTDLPPEGELPVLAGGQRFASDFGTFLAPNISPDPEHGIGGWSALDLLTAMTKGTSPEGYHYYPAFPYASYAKADPQDVADLHAFLMTLPASDTPSQKHEVGFPFNIRLALGGWKLLFLNDDWVLDEAPTPELERGRYLVEALGHCAECHTPRNALGGMVTEEWLAGAPVPGGQGNFPNITPGALDWSAEDIAYYLETGFTPDFDVTGGHMAFVVTEFAKLPAEDRAAVAAYLKAIPAVN